MKKYIFAACIIIIGIFSYLTIRQNKVWKDIFTFWAYTAEHAEYSAKAYNALAVEYISLEVAIVILLDTTLGAVNLANTALNTLGKIVGGSL